MGIEDIHAPEDLSVVNNKPAPWGDNSELKRVLKLYSVKKSQSIFNENVNTDETFEIIGKRINALSGSDDIQQRSTYEQQFLEIFFQVITQIRLEHIGPTTASRQLRKRINEGDQHVVNELSVIYALMKNTTIETAHTTVTSVLQSKNRNKNDVNGLIDLYIQSISFALGLSQEKGTVVDATNLEQNVVLDAITKETQLDQIYKKVFNTFDEKNQKKLSEQSPEKMRFLMNDLIEYGANEGVDDTVAIRIIERIGSLTAEEQFQFYSCISQQGLTIKKTFGNVLVTFKDDIQNFIGAGLEKCQTILAKKNFEMYEMNGSIQRGTASQHNFILAGYNGIQLVNGTPKNMITTRWDDGVDNGTRQVDLDTAETTWLLHLMDIEGQLPGSLGFLEKYVGSMSGDTHRKRNVVVQFYRIYEEVLSLGPSYLSSIPQMERRRLFTQIVNQERGIKEAWTGQIDEQGDDITVPYSELLALYENHLFEQASHLSLKKQQDEAKLLHKKHASESEKTQAALDSFMKSQSRYKQLLKRFISNSGSYSLDLKDSNSYWNFFMGQEEQKNEKAEESFRDLGKSVTEVLNAKDNYLDEQESLKDQLFSQYLIAFDQMTLARRFDLRDDLLLELASTFGHTYLTQHAHMQQAATELLQRLTPRPGEKEDYRYAIMKVALFDNPHDYSSLLAQSPGDENIDDQFAMLQARESIRDYTHISIPGSFENTYYERIYGSSYVVGKKSPHLSEISVGGSRYLCDMRSISQYGFTSMSDLLNTIARTYGLQNQGMNRLKDVGFLMHDSSEFLNTAQEKKVGGKEPLYTLDLENIEIYWRDKNEGGANGASGFQRFTLTHAMFDKQSPRSINTQKIPNITKESFHTDQKVKTGDSEIRKRMYEKDQKIQTLSHLQVVSKISNLTEKLSISLNPFRTTIGQAKAPKNIIAELRTSLGEIGLLKQELQTLITTEPFSLKKDTLATYLKDYSSGIYEDKSEEILTGMEKQIETLDWYVKVVLPSIEAALNTYTSLRPNDFADWMKTDGARMIASIAVGILILQGLGGIAGAWYLVAGRVALSSAMTVISDELIVPVQNKLYNDTDWGRSLLGINDNADGKTDVTFHQYNLRMLEHNGMITTEEQMKQYLQMFVRNAFFEVGGVVMAKYGRKKGVEFGNPIKQKITKEIDSFLARYGSAFDTPELMKTCILNMQRILKKPTVFVKETVDEIGDEAKEEIANTMIETITHEMGGQAELLFLLMQRRQRSNTAGSSLEGTASSDGTSDHIDTGSFLQEYGMTIFDVTGSDTEGFTTTFEVDEDALSKLEEYFRVFVGQEGISFLPYNEDFGVGGVLFRGGSDAISRKYFFKVTTTPVPLRPFLADIETSLIPYVPVESSGFPLLEATNSVSDGTFFLHPYSEKTYEKFKKRVTSEYVVQEHVRIKSDPLGHEIFVIDNGIESYTIHNMSQETYKNYQYSKIALVKMGSLYDEYSQGTDPFLKLTGVPFSEIFSVSLTTGNLECRCSVSHMSGVVALFRKMGMKISSTMPGGDGSKRIKIVDLLPNAPKKSHFDLELLPISEETTVFDILGAGGGFTRFEGGRDQNGLRWYPTSIADIEEGYKKLQELKTRNIIGELSRTQGNGMTVFAVTFHGGHKLSIVVQSSTLSTLTGMANYYEIEDAKRGWLEKLHHHDVTQDQVKNIGERLEDAFITLDLTGEDKREERKVWMNLLSNELSKTSSKEGYTLNGFMLHFATYLDQIKKGDVSLDTQEMTLSVLSHMGEIINLDDHDTIKSTIEGMTSSELHSLYTLLQIAKTAIMVHVDNDLDQNKKKMIQTKIIDCLHAITVSSSSLEMLRGSLLLDHIMQSPLGHVMYVGTLMPGSSWGDVINDLKLLDGPSHKVLVESLVDVPGFLSYCHRHHHDPDVQSLYSQDISSHIYESLSQPYVDKHLQESYIALEVAHSVLNDLLITYNSLGLSGDSLKSLREKAFDVVLSNDDYSNDSKIDPFNVVNNAEEYIRVFVDKHKDDLVVENGIYRMRNKDEFPGLYQQMSIQQKITTEILLHQINQVNQAIISDQYIGYIKDENNGMGEQATFEGGVSSRLALLEYEELQDLFVNLPEDTLIENLLGGSLYALDQKIYFEYYYKTDAIRGVTSPKFSDEMRGQTVTNDLADIPPGQLRRQQRLLVSTLAQDPATWMLYHNLIGHELLRAPKGTFYHTLLSQKHRDTTLIPPSMLQSVDLQGVSIESFISYLVSCSKVIDLSSFHTIQDHKGGGNQDSPVGRFTQVQEYLKSMPEDDLRAISPSLSSLVLGKRVQFISDFALLSDKEKQILSAWNLLLSEK